MQRIQKIKGEQRKRMLVLDLPSWLVALAAYETQDNRPTRKYSFT